MVRSSGAPESKGGSGELRNHLALVGLMGVGKTEVGAAVARRMGRRHVDLDRAITQLAGKSVGVIFHESGEEEFRELESECLALQLEAKDPIVLSTGGGVLERDENRAAMAAVTVAWLRATPVTLAKRVAGGAGRPLLAGGDPLTILDDLSKVRSPSYKAAANLVVDTDGLSVDEVADNLLNALANRKTAGGRL
ncbi:MAG: shikimate kinase [Acidimicrobiaceae bacterium]|nr:shikimate kinase [Acidimicrobiaceae bacterium]